MGSRGLFLPASSVRANDRDPWRRGLIDTNSAHDDDDDLPANPKRNVSSETLGILAGDPHVHRQLKRRMGRDERGLPQEV